MNVNVIFLGFLRQVNQIDATFKILDLNGDKTLNTAEIDAAQKKQVAQVQANMGKRLDAEFAKYARGKANAMAARRC